jgi:hypothetical protein
LPVGKFPIVIVTTEPALSEGKVLPASGAPVASVKVTLVVGAATDAEDPPMTRAPAVKAMISFFISLFSLLIL